MTDLHNLQTEGPSTSGAEETARPKHNGESTTSFADGKDGEEISAMGEVFISSPSYMVHQEVITRPAGDTGIEGVSVGSTKANELNTQPPVIRLKQTEDQFYDILCKSSCKGSCGGPNARPGSQCYCDAVCQQLGDCCLDYEAACLSGPNVTRDNYVDNVRSRQPLPLECVTIWTNAFYSDVLVVTSCSRNYTRKDNIVVRRMCQRPLLEEKNISTELPVMFRNVIYRNRYCAVCNNPDFDLNETTRPKFNISCGRNSSIAYEVWRRDGVDAFVSYAIVACKFHVDISDFENLQRDHNRYDCTLLAGIPSRCEKEIDSASKYMQSTCRVYRADVVHPQSLTRYRNPHCAVCDGASFTDLSCPLFQWPMIFGPNLQHLPSFTLLLDFRGEQRLAYEATPLCPPHLLPDYTRDTCVIPTCPPGHVSLKDKINCTKLKVKVEQILSLRNNAATTVVTALDIPPDVTSKEYDQIEKSLLLVVQRININGIELIVDVSYHTECVKLYESLLLTFEDTCWNCTEHNSTCFAYQLSNIQFRKIVPHINSTKKDIISELNKTFTATLKELFVLNHDINEILDNCSVGTSRIRNKLVFLGYDLSRGTFPPTFIDTNTSLTYKTDEVPVCLSWQVNVSEPSGWFEQYAALVCEPDILTCETVTFQAGEYIDMGKSLLLRHSETNVSKRDVFRLDSDTIVLCAALLPNLTIQHQTIWQESPGEGDIKGILTLVGNIFSMICLAFTMVTYCLFPSLRNVPGKSVMHLTIALFLAQLSFQVSATLVSYREACIVAGALQHYAWLAAFLWMNVLAYNICVTFVYLMPSTDIANTARLRAFALYAWGFPAVFVAVCLSIDFGTELPFNYGGKTTCFIVGHNAVVYYFATPLAVIIAANIVFFVRTIFALRSAMLLGNQARNSQQRRNTFVIYVRLTSLMGFTWLFGFLANINALYFLWYLFIICNTLQGVFICFSFAVNYQVRQLWRSRLYTHRDKRNGFSRTPMSNDSPTSVTHDCENTRL